MIQHPKKPAHDMLPYGHWLHPDGTRAHTSWRLCITPCGDSPIVVEEVVCVHRVLVADGPKKGADLVVGLGRRAQDQLFDGREAEVFDHLQSSRTRTMLGQVRSTRPGGPDQLARHGRTALLIGSSSRTFQCIDLEGYKCQQQLQVILTQLCNVQCGLRTPNRWKLLVRAL